MSSRRVAPGRTGTAAATSGAIRRAFSSIAAWYVAHAAGHRHIVRRRQDAQDQGERLGLDGQGARQFGGGPGPVAECLEHAAARGGHERAGLHEGHERIEEGSEPVRTEESALRRGRRRLAHTASDRHSGQPATRSPAREMSQMGQPAANLLTPTTARLRMVR